MDLFDLYAKLSLNAKDYEKGLNDAEKSAGGFGEKLGSIFKTVGKVSFAALSATAATATTVTTMLVKSATTAYADYEQLVGGVETLFGAGSKNLGEYAKSVGVTSIRNAEEMELVQERFDKLMRAQDTVFKNASNAYKTAGLSANEYMETVTSFSASLISSLGGNTERAAFYADKAITDMSDNANKMGSSMESIQNAYQGFAKQNYMMLDNLKLGYGGTKTEMERLILDAEKMNSSFKAVRDENGDLAMSYADIVDAIHIVQTNMGITGTTAKEASETISGSVASAKAAWQNLITGLADKNADIPKLIDNVVESVKTAAKNIVPAVMQSLEGVGQLITELAPVIADAIPKLVSNILPGFLSSVTTVISAFVNAFSDDNNLDAIVNAFINVALMLVDVLIKTVPKLIKAVIKIIKTVASALIQNVKPIMKAVTDALTEIIALITDPTFLPEIVNAGIKMLMSLVDGLLLALPKLIEVAPQLITDLITAIVSAIPQIQECSATLIETLVEGIVDNLPAIMDGAISIILSLADALTDPDTILTLTDATFKIMFALQKGLISALPTLIEKIPDLIMGLHNAFIDNSVQLIQTAKELIKQMGKGIIGSKYDIRQWGTDIINEIWESIKLAWSKVRSWAGEIIKVIGDGFTRALPKVKEVGSNIVEGVWEGIKSMANWLGNKVSGFFDGIVADIKGSLGIHSPSKVFAQIGAFAAEGFGVGFDKAFDDVAKDVQAEMGLITDKDVNINGNGNGSMLGTMRKVEDLLTQIRDKDTTIVLDDGTLVGRVDRMLGQTAMRKARGNA